jgi:acetyl esterase/lipase
VKVARSSIDLLFYALCGPGTRRAAWGGHQAARDLSPAPRTASLREPRVPVSQGHEHSRPLKKLGVPVKMVVYPRMPHGSIEPKFTLRIMEEHLASLGLGGKVSAVNFLYP